MTLIAGDFVGLDAGLRYRTSASLVLGNTVNIGAQARNLFGHTQNLDGHS